MLHPKVKRNFEASLDNSSFVEELVVADKENLLNSDLSNPVNQSIVAAIYYGWLVAKYGKDWQNHIYDKN